jgi:hypothetical protein
MEKYPSIPREVRYGGPYLIYDKLDGQNIRAEWDAKKGFWKYGSRKVLAELPQVCVDLVNDLEDVVAKVFKKLRIRRATLFFEFYGDRSFAGMHDPTDTMKIALLDVHLTDQKRWMDPRDVEKKFRGKVPMPTLLLRGNFNKEVEAAVNDGTLEGMTFEGVVCKAPPASKGAGSVNVMFKCKNRAWVDKVKDRYPDSEDLL